MAENNSPQFCNFAFSDNQFCFLLKEIYTRTLTGFVFIVAVIGSVLLHPLVFFILFSAVTYLGLQEFLKLSPVESSPQNNRVYFAGGMLVYFLTALMGLGYIHLQFAYLLLMVFFLVFVFELFRKDEDSRQRIGTWFTGFVYIALPFGLMNSLFVTGNLEGFRTDILIGLFIIIWTSDVFAYLVGSRLGKHKLFERISPKKTWEGSLGGLLFALLAAYILSLFYTLFSLTEWMILAVIIVLTGALGDLIESMLKRQAGLKDSGTLFPGHGGVLDRFDAVMFATPFVFVYVNLISL